MHFIRNEKLATVGGLIVLAFVVLAIFAPWIAPMEPCKASPTDALMAPGGKYLLGTDILGRDLLSRLIYGARISLSVAFAAVGVGAVIGVLLGLVAGWYMGLEMLVMRFVDVLLCFPAIIVALTIISVLGVGIQNIIFAIAISRTPEFARLTYSLAISVRHNTYVEAAIAVGASSKRIMFCHILPNIIPPIIVQVSLMIPGAIMIVAGLSFLGLGVAPPTPEWGAMLQDSRVWARMAPHLMVFPGLTIMMVVFGFNTLGDGLRDALDPRLARL
jgi:peptide/nickel transport system permease protein